MNSDPTDAGPVELLTRSPDDIATRFLVPVDLSEASERAMRWVLEPRSERTAFIRVLLLPTPDGHDAGDLVRFLGRFKGPKHALVHGQVLQAGVDDLAQQSTEICRVLTRESIQKIVVGVGGADDEVTQAGALAQHLAKHCPCGVIVVPARQPVYELIRL